MKKRKKSPPWKNWSASKSELLLFKCPLAFYFQYVLRLVVRQGIEKLFGQAIHRMAKTFFTLNYESEESFLGNWKYYWWGEMLGKKYKGMVRVKNPKDPGKFFATGINILKRFYQENLPYQTGELPRPEVEKRFDRIFKGHPITGKKDRIQPLLNGQIEIWDYKTGLRKYTQKELVRDIQFTLYNLDHFKRFGQNPVNMWIDQLFYGEKIPIPIRTVRDYQQLGRWLDEARMYVKNILVPSSNQWEDFPFRWLNPEDIERQYFSPRPSGFCNICDFEHACRDWQPQDSMRELWIKQELEQTGPCPEYLQLELPFSKLKKKRRKKAPAKLSSPLHISEILANMFGQEITEEIGKEVFKKGREILPEYCLCQEEGTLPIDALSLILNSLKRQEKITAGQICQYCSKKNCPAKVQLDSQKIH